MIEFESKRMDLDYQGTISFSYLNNQLVLVICVDIALDLNVVLYANFNFTRMLSSQDILNLVH